MSTISIELQDELKAQLEGKAKALNMKTSDLIVKALSDFFYLEKIEAVRQRINPKFTKSGYHSDQDVFDKVS